MADDAMTRPDERRQFERWQAEERARLTVGDVTVEAKIENASAGGLALRAQVAVTAGDTVYVEMKGLPRSAMTVVRSNGDFIALQFQDGPNYHFR